MNESKYKYIEEKAKKFFPFLFFLLLGFIYFWQFFLLKKIPVPADILPYFFPIGEKGHLANPLVSDVILQIYPFKSIVFEGWRNFDLHFWNQYLFSGESFIANVQPGYFYPLNFFSFFFNNTVAFSFLILSQLVLGGIFMYLFLKELGLSKIPSYFGAVAFIFSGPITVWLEWGTMASTFIWLPLVLYFFLRAVKEFSLRNSLFAGIALGISSLAGHFQILLYVYGMSFVFALFINLTSKIPFRNKLFNIFFPFLVALFVGFIQIFPSLQISSEVFRASAPDFRSLFFYPFKNFITLLMPNFYGNPVTGNYWGDFNYSELAIYSGVIPLVLLPFSLIYLKNKKIIFFWAALVITFLLFIGTPLYWIPFKLIPPLQKLPPIRVACLFSFLLIVLSSFSLDRIFFHNRLKEVLVSKRKFFLFYTFLIVLFVIVAIFYPNFTRKEELANKYHEYLNSNILKASVLVLLPLSFVALKIFFKTRFSRFLALLLMVFSTADLFYFSYAYNPFTSADNIYPDNIGYINYIKNDAEIYRVYAPYAGGNDILMSYHIQAIDGYDSMYPKQYLDFMSASADNQKNQGNWIVAGTIYPEILDLLNVKYMVTREDDSVDDGSLEKVFSSKKYHVYKNKDFMDRAFLVGKCRSENDPESLKDIKEHKINYREEAVLEESEKNICDELEKSYNSSAHLGDAKITEYGSDYLSIEENASEDSILVLTDSFEKNWKVFVDGKENKVLRTDYNFRGVFLKKGQHLVEFKFNPFNSLSATHLPISFTIGIGR